MPNHSAEAVDIYVHWLYRRTIPGDIAALRAEDENGEHCAPQTRLLVSAYLLGDYLIDDLFKDAIMSALFDKLYEHSKISVSHICAETVTAIYVGTPAGSRARKFLVDAVRDRCSRDDLTAILTTTPQKFQTDLTLSYASEKGRGYWDGWRLRKCDYHRHESTVEPTRTAEDIFSQVFRVYSASQPTM